jgi:hypothetical protein
LGESIGTLSIEPHLTLEAQKMKITTVLGCVTAAVLSFGIFAAEETANPTRTETILAEAEGKPELVELLFVQQADRATLKDGVLTLEGVGSNVLYFSDRPERIIGRESLEQFIAQWDAGEHSFAAVPPNAVLTVVKGGEELDAVFVLKNPVKTGDDTMTYEVEQLEGPSAGFGDHAALFIDAFGIGKPGDPGGLRGAKRGKPGDPGGLRGGEPGKPGDPDDLRGAEPGIPGAEPGVPGRIGRGDARKFQKARALDRML